MSPAVFLTLYALCGLTDVADGIVARKTNTQSKTGARLDTIAD
jgi:CDP-diacylglycerol--glycerol-3-phosphate 3-phosphatidyltransferase